jgi:undecaprenyl-diphosphatase
MAQAAAAALETPGMRSATARLRDINLVTLVSALLVLLAVWIFVGIAYLVSEGSTQQLDESVLRALRSPTDPADAWGPSWLEDMARDITALGGVAALCLATIGVAGYLLMVRRYRGLALLLGATLGGTLLSALLKQLFYRERPNIVPHLSYVSDPSFPSGHSMLSAVVYLTLGALLARVVEKRRVKLYFLLVALWISFLVGISRVYMGVHYPTDVLAGWSAGVAWGLFCNLLASWLQRRGAVERTPPQIY